jgi:hypothetical protein
VAWDVAPGQGREDLTPYITMTQSRDDCDAEDVQVRTLASKAAFFLLRYQHQLFL